MKLFERQLGIELVHVPYKGGPRIHDGVVARRGRVCIAGMVTMAPHIKSGAVRALATFAPRRLATHPELPTMAELGYPELEFSGWLGVVAPAGTPPEVIERLRMELADIVAEARHEGSSCSNGAWSPRGWGRPSSARLIHSELQRYGRLVREARITVD